MKIPNERLRELYLKDLTLPDIHHGRTTPKTKYPASWAAINSTYKNGPLDIAKAVEEGRNVWIWSDTHFGHKNIIAYAERPFNSIEAMNNQMIANYLTVVQPNDVVIWLGDIGFMSENKINEVLDSLPGYKIHIIGNHDMHRDGKVYKLNMDEQHLCYSLGIGGIELLFTHYPLDTVPSNCQNVCGHIHQNHANVWNTIACVEHLDYTPANLNNLIVEAQNKILQRKGK
jgi:calcineurin-like phosphoesterase family protein